jgi:antitoxin ParD1/3/4
MPTRNISLTDKHDALIREAIACGDFKDASEVVREALRLLDRKQRTEQAKLDRLLGASDAEYDAWFRAQVQEAIDEADSPDAVCMSQSEVELKFLGKTLKKAGKLAA